jgi:predicted DNA-binding transcriptional regulator
MSKDQGYGFVIFLISIVVLIGYVIAFFAPLLRLPAVWREWAISVPVLLFALLVLVISGWIGWTMLTTPPPAPLEPEPATEPTKEPT